MKLGAGSFIKNYPRVQILVKTGLQKMTLYTKTYSLFTRGNDLETTSGIPRKKDPHIPAHATT
jgi:hypothetical protein